jgi:putative intracellular protease/amidase
MTAIVVALTPDYADWECALLMAVARSYLDVTVKTATADGHRVVSMGGLAVTPDLAFADVKPQDYDAIVVPGGLAWERSLVPDTLHGLVRSFRDNKKMAAGICAAASMLAGAGVLNDVGHTGNRLASHQAYPGYTGAAHYVDGPCAVLSNGVVTAAGTSPYTFTVEILKGLGLWNAMAEEELAPFSAEHR